MGGGEIIDFLPRNILVIIFIGLPIIALLLFSQMKNEEIIEQKVLSLAKKKTEKRISIYTTDGFTTYENVIKSVVSYYNLKKGLIKHNKITQLKGEGFNYKIERLHNSVRHRIKTFRGFHGSLSSANFIMKGYEVYYNFIRKHLAINCCPYELAVPNLKLNSNNKWLELIGLSQECS